HNTVPAPHPPPHSPLSLHDALPISELTLRQRKLGMAGRSAGAARLIGLLSADPTIGDAAFAAPVTRAEQGGVDAFSIRAELRMRSEEHTSELQSLRHLVCRLLLEKK